MHAFRNATIDPSRPFVNSRAAGNYWMAHTHARLIHFGTQREEERTAVYDCTYTYVCAHVHACMHVTVLVTIPGIRLLGFWQWYGLF
jgi:hypothetical protein